MTIPRSVTIAGISVRILREDLSDEDNLPKGYYGYFSHERKVIVVDKRMGRAMTRDTIRHEMLHAALSFSGLDRLEGFEEEAIVSCMDEIFFPAWEKLLRGFNKK